MSPSMKRLVRIIINNGGRPMLIGGAVIDSIKGLPIKDWDIEVYGLNYFQLADVLESNGYKADLVGKSFGIIKTKAGDFDVDLSIPRRENKVGIGHKGFEVEFDPDMTPEEAGRRRDLTINSMYLDLSTNKIVDPFNGLKDLESGIIRATDPKTFVEDPLRVLRIMQLLPRKGKVVDPATLKLCQSMVEEFPTLSSERVFEEFNKLLLKAPKPSIGLEFLRKSRWIKWFPELNSLIGCQQNPEWHPEGDVWNHTLMVVDNAAMLKDSVPEDWRLAFMYGALLHDLGKPAVTDPIKLTAWGHDIAGVDPAGSFMHRLTDSKVLIDRVIRLVRWHMTPGGLFRGQAKLSAWKRLHNNIRLDVLGYLTKADSCGRPGRKLSDPHPVSEQCLKLFAEFGEGKIKPKVMGRHLITKGLKPGPHFGGLLKKAYDIQLEYPELSEDEILNKIGDLL